MPSSDTQLSLLVEDVPRALPTLPCDVGRGSHCAVTLDDPALADIQFTLAERDGNWILISRGKRDSPTRLNDHPLPYGAPHALRDGDTIEVGRHALEFCVDCVPLAVGDAPPTGQAATAWNAEDAPARVNVPLIATWAAVSLLSLVLVGQALFGGPDVTPPRPVASIPQPLRSLDTRREPVQRKPPSTTQSPAVDAHLTRRDPLPRQHTPAAANERILPRDPAPVDIPGIGSGSATAADVKRDASDGEGNGSSQSERPETNAGDGSAATREDPASGAGSDQSRPKDPAQDVDGPGSGGGPIDGAGSGSTAAKQPPKKADVGKTETPRGKPKDAKPSKTKPTKEKSVGKSITFWGRRLHGSGVVWVIDQSASIGNLQLKLRRELARSMKQLTPMHTFNIVVFHADAVFFAPELVPGDQYNIKRAWKWVKDQHTRGMTRVMLAFRAAVSFKGASTVCLLTDGKVSYDEFVTIRDYMLRRIRDPKAAASTPYIELIPMTDEFHRAEARLKALLKVARQQPEYLAARAKKAKLSKKPPKKKPEAKPTGAQVEFD